MDVVIAGAGISGLAAAISLRRSGHRVTIYERSSLNNEIGAAINIPPNVGRFLLPWGLDPVGCRLVTSQGMYFMSPTNLEELAGHSFSGVAQAFGAPLYYAHRVDLHESLKWMATEPGALGVPAVINLKSAVQNYDPDTPSITLTNGRTITADLVIAADGVHSSAVEAILGKTNPPSPAKHANCCYRFLISRHDLESDPETKFFLEGQQPLGCRIWPDNENQRRLVCYSCRNHEVYNFVAICCNDKIMTKREDWQATVDKSEVLNKYTGYHPSLLAVINKATDVKRWPLLYRPPISTWYKGNMTLAGDAAHPMLPHHGQGGAQGIEDGLALGLCFNDMKDKTEIRKRLAIYERIRRNRAASIQVLSNYGFDEGAPAELAKFLEGEPSPTSVTEMIKLAYGHDTLQKTIKHMTEYDPAFEVSDGFFPHSVDVGTVNGNYPGPTH
ncbi:hypothetical protein B0J14DRAFT_571724 [Halenospora varia]|nr:hypothetical protein B0J14DRAFT_571724 [Halenospora varia]